MSIKAGAFDITWDPASRVATLTCAPGTSLGGADGVALVAALKTWVDGDTAPYAVLVDAAGIGRTEPELRAVVRAFFTAHRARLRIALYNLTPLLRVTAEMFRIGARVNLRPFATESDARSWLRENGPT